MNTRKKLTGGEVEDCLLVLSCCLFLGFTVQETSIPMCGFFNYCTYFGVDYMTIAYLIATFVICYLCNGVFF